MDEEHPSWEYIGLWSRSYSSSESESSSPLDSSCCSTANSSQRLNKWRARQLTRLTWHDGFLGLRSCLLQWIHLPLNVCKTALLLSPTHWLALFLDRRSSSHTRSFGGFHVCPNIFLNMWKITCNQLVNLPKYGSADGINVEFECLISASLEIGVSWCEKFTQ